MTKSITVASGKRGIGKSCIAVNLALTYARSGQRVTLIDADFGPANAHVLMGCNLRQGPRDVLSGTDVVSEVTEVTEGGVRLISGGSGTVEMLNLNQTTRAQAIRKLQSIAASSDIVIVDAPAGASDNALAFAAASSRFLLVLVGEPTSFVDGYAMVKAARLDYGIRNFSCVFNMAKNRADAWKHYKKFRDVAQKFLDIEVRFAGYLPFSLPIRKSVLSRCPIVRSNPQSRETLAFKSLAHGVLLGPANTPDELALTARVPIRARA